MKMRRLFFVAADVTRLKSFGESRASRAYLPNRAKVGRAVPSAPTELTNADELEWTLKNRGALGTARPTFRLLFELRNALSPRLLLLSTLTLVGLLLAIAASAEENWPHWRGAQDEGSVESGNYPVKWEGEQVWKKPFGKENSGRHRNGSGSNASPATDGKAAFVYFKSGTFAALELDGKVRWQTNLVDRFGPDTLYWDHGTSPVLTGNYVVMV